jgi:hypothetical protein
MIDRHAGITAAIARFLKDCVDRIDGNSTRPSAAGRQIAVPFGRIPPIGRVPSAIATGTIPGATAIIYELATPAPPPRPQTGNRWRPALSPRAGRNDRGPIGATSMLITANEPAITSRWKRHWSNIAFALQSSRTQQEFPIGSLIDPSSRSRHVPSSHASYGRQSR